MAAMIDEASLYSVDELATLFEVSPLTIRRLIRRTGLPLRRVGHKRFVRGADFLEATLHAPDDDEREDDAA